MRFRTLALVSAAVFASVFLIRAQAPAGYDVLIRGGHIVDGSGNPWVLGDVAIASGRIAAVGRIPNGTARRVIEATGSRRRAGIHRPPHALRHAAARGRHRAEQGAAGRDHRRHRRIELGGAARRAEGGRTSRDHSAGLDDLYRLFRSPEAARHLDEPHLARVGRAGAPRRDGIRRRARPRPLKSGR